MLQILNCVHNPRSLRNLHMPLTEFLKVTWLDNKAALSKKELAAIFSNARITIAGQTKSSMCRIQ